MWKWRRKRWWDGVSAGGQSEALVVGTGITKAEIEVRRREGSKDGSTEGGGILPPVSLKELSPVGTH